MTRGLRLVGLVGFVALLTTVGRAPGQGSDAALKDRVAQLVGRLDSEKSDVADAAQKSLIDLGAKALPLLADAEKGAKEAAKARLVKVRAALATAEVDATNLGASKVTLKGTGIRLSEAIKSLQSKTGNTINDLREQQGGDTPNPAIDLDIVDRPFFEALDIVAEKAGVSLSFTTGDGSIGLMAGSPPGGPVMAKPMVVYSGPFRILFKQIGSVRDFTTGVGTTDAQFDVAWEPRLRPMLMALKAEGIKVVADDGKPVPPVVTQQTDDVVLHPENPVAELNLNLNAPSRSAKELATVGIKGEITVPAGLKMFRFKNIEAKDVVVKEKDISVTLESTTVEESTWKISIVVAYPSGGPAFESYRQGLFNNRIWLQKADGSRFEHNGGFNNNGAADGKLGFEYLFVDVPGKLSDYGLVYETPKPSDRDSAGIRVQEGALALTDPR